MEKEATQNADFEFQYGVGKTCSPGSKICEKETFSLFADKYQTNTILKCSYLKQTKNWYFIIARH